MKKLLVMLASVFAFSTAFAAVDLNTATQQDLETVKGIGPAKSKAILEYRSKNGPFKSVDDLAKAVLALNRAIGIPDAFSKIGVPANAFELEFETLVENSLKGATRSNPTPVSAADMRILLRDVFTGKAL